MISIVKASSKSLNNITINLPYHRVIAITGNHTLAGISLINDILFREAITRISTLLEPNIYSNQIQNTTGNAEFIAGLYAPTYLDGLIFQNQNFVQLCQGLNPFIHNGSGFTLNAGLSIDANLNLFTKGLQPETNPSWQTTSVKRLLENLCKLGFGPINAGTSINTLNPFQLPFIALAHAHASSMQGLMYTLDLSNMPKSSDNNAELFEILHSLRANGNTVFIITPNASDLKQSDWILEFESLPDSALSNLVYCGSSKLYFEKPTRFLASLTDFTNAPSSNSNQKVSGPFGEMPIMLNGVTTHNLQNISVTIPYKKLTTLTGISGSGKSSLAFDTLLTLAQSKWQSLLAQREDAPTQGECELQHANGLMPSIGVRPYTTPIDLIKNIATISRIHPALERLFDLVSDSSSPSEIESVTLEHILALSITDALHLTRRWATLPQRISEQPVIAKRAMLPLASVINKLDILSLLGLGYLSLSRLMSSLSGGEQQRVRLGTAISSELSGLCFVLDEPTRGLHPTDVNNLMLVLRELNRQGNTILACEHNPQFIMFSDNIIDLGPGSAGKGGRIVVQGTPSVILSHPDSITGKYLSNLPAYNRQTKVGYSKNMISINGATANNLKNINISIPTEVITVIHGVSGSGKSSLLEQVIYSSFNASKAVGCSSISGFEYFNKVVLVSQQCLLDETELTIFEKFANAENALNTELAKLLSIEHLNLTRKLRTLSSGEFQRLMLLLALQTSDTEQTLFLLDEPTAGLHLQDVQNLIKAFEGLIERKHTLVVSEHHSALINVADQVIELGPGAGPIGGELVYNGPNTNSYKTYIANRITSA